MDDAYQGLLLLAWMVPTIGVFGPVSCRRLFVCSYPGRRMTEMICVGFSDIAGDRLMATRVARTQGGDCVRKLQDMAKGFGFGGSFDPRHRKDV